MVQEKMYYCLHNQKVLLVFKDEHGFLNCYEIEDAEIIENVKNCTNADEIEQSIESYITKHISNIKINAKEQKQPIPMSEQDKPTEAEEIFAESQQIRSHDASDKIEESPEAETEKKTRDVIFVGTKPIMTYVTATLTQLSAQPVVTIKARGQRITQAVDVSQMIVKRMNTVGYIIKDVRIASDSLLSQDGKTRNVSTIEIDITKP
jgi:DNA-binding protein